MIVGAKRLRSSRGIEGDRCTKGVVNNCHVTVERHIPSVNVVAIAGLLDVFVRGERRSHGSALKVLVGDLQRPRHMAVVSVQKHLRSIINRLLGPFNL